MARPNTSGGRMGCRRLSQRALAALLPLLVIAAFGCSPGGGAAPPTPTPELVATATPTPTESPTATPTATQTPDILPARPNSALKAQVRMDAYLRAGGTPCTSSFKQKWGVLACYTADFDGDRKDDTAALITLERGENPSPGLLVVVRPGAPSIVLPDAAQIDAGKIGREFVSVADRNGDGRPDILYLTTVCGATNCASQTEIQSWDGTAWRDLVVPGAALDNVDSAKVAGSGTASAITVHTGALTSAGAGPTRPATVTFTYQEGAYRATNIAPDAPVFLIHAILDADKLFEAGKFDAAQAAYKAAVADSRLKDWQAESGKAPGRPALVGYALFRVSLAAAAAGAPQPEARAAFDAVFTGSTDPLFHNVVETFRRGYLESNGGVRAGCTEVTRYLLQPDVTPFLREAFDYGFANPRRTATDICPL
ncbi:MAG: hypothetical protein ACKVVT_18875 [Dehalococcoidia bacterium]